MSFVARSGFSVANCTANFAAFGGRQMWRSTKVVEVIWKSLPLPKLHTNILLFCGSFAAIRLIPTHNLPKDNLIISGLWRHLPKLCRTVFHPVRNLILMHETVKCVLSTWKLEGCNIAIAMPHGYGEAKVNVNARVKALTANIWYPQGPRHKCALLISAVRRQCSPAMQIVSSVNQSTETNCRADHKNVRL